MKRAYGFTIVELLIVIVVIGILAAVSIVAYNDVAAKARDSQRLQDAASILKGLEMYKIETGNFPAANASPGIEGWEVSVDSGFLSPLLVHMSPIPLDPTNNTSHHYRYYRDPAGAYGCTASAGPLAVVRVYGLERVDGRTVSDLGPCEGATLSASRTPSQTQAVFIRGQNG